MKTNVVLIIGQNKDESVFNRSINVYKTRQDVDRVVIVTWSDTNLNDINDEKIHTIRVDNPGNFVYDGRPGRSIEYQKYLYDIGLDHINKTCSSDVYILKTRMDFFISDDQLDYIFSQNYCIESPSAINYKIWVPWAHVTKPLYLEDGCFYSHLSVMNLLSPCIDETLVNIGQGHSHIRWFAKLSDHYNLYDNAVFRDKNNIYKEMTSEFTYTEVYKNILSKYMKCLSECFIIKTVDDGIEFRSWNNTKSYTLPSTNINDIIQTPAEHRLKIVHDSKDLTSIDLRRNVDRLTVYKSPIIKTRFGRNMDGGYVGVEVESDILLSGGIGHDISFELDYANRYNVPIICVDSEFCQGPYETLEKFIKAYPENNTEAFSRLEFVKKLVGDEENEKYTCFTSYFEQFENITIKLDIEGGEYDFLRSLPMASQNKVNLLFVEFHDLHKLDDFNLFDKLDKTHVLIHAHGNNCGVKKKTLQKLFKCNDVSVPRVLECTYLHKKYFDTFELNNTDLPGELDFPNNPDIKADLNLNFPPFVNK